MTRPRVPRRARWLLAIGLVVVSAAGVATTELSPAAAYWPSVGVGSGVAQVGTITAPSVSATSPSFTSSVSVTWSAASVPAGASVTGYFVTRYAGAVGSVACSSGPGSLLPVTPHSCTDAGVPGGTYTYRVTAVLASWTATSAASPAVTVSPDVTAPTMTLTGANTSNAYLSLFSGYRVYFRGNAVGGGGLSIVAAVTDAGSGPASATFPVIGTTGWTHNAETVTSGTGSAPTVAYASAPFTFTQSPLTPATKAVVGRDVIGSQLSTNVVFVSDVTAPGSGALGVNSVAATLAGSTSKNATGSFTIGTVTPYTEVQSTARSGIASSELTRAFSPLVYGVCTAFEAGEPVIGTAPITEVDLAIGCYRYVLTGRDQVGNVASLTTTVWVDTTPALGGAVSANSVAGDTIETTSTSPAGAWPLTRTDYTDPESGGSSTLVRTRTTFSGGICGGSPSTSTLTGTPTQSPMGTYCYQYRLTGTNGVNTALSVSTLVKSDISAPTGGALTVNGRVATTVGASVNNTTGSYSVSLVTPYVDTHSTATNQLTRVSAALVGGVCDPFDPGTETVLPVATTSGSGLATGCYRYSLTGTNGVGTSVVISTTVKVDVTAPDDGVLTANGVLATTAGSTAGSGDGTVALTRVDFADGDSGVTSSILRRGFNAVSNGICSGTVSTIILTGVPSQIGLATGCYRYYLTGINAFAGTSVIAVTVLVDATAPTGGALTVNGTGASVPGTTSTNTSGNVTISALTGYTDGQSGVTNVVTRTFVPMAANVCGDFATGTDTVISGSAPINQTGLDPGCYRYTLRGTNGAGTAVTLTTTVKVDTTPPNAGQLRANAIDATPGGSSSWRTDGTFALLRVDYDDPETGSTSVLTGDSAPLSGGNCGTFSGASTLIGAPDQSVSDGCSRYVLSATNGLGLSSTVTTTVKVDSTPPSGGVLTVNGLNASAVGTTSGATGSFDITTVTPFTDVQSGMSPAVLLRAFAPPDGPGCGTFGADAPITAAPMTETAPAAGCYRYTLSGTNAAGGNAAIVTTVIVGP